MMQCLSAGRSYINFTFQHTLLVVIDAQKHKYFHLSDYRRPSDINNLSTLAPCRTFVSQHQDIKYHCTLHIMDMGYLSLVPAVSYKNAQNIISLMTDLFSPYISPSLHILHKIGPRGKCRHYIHILYYLSTTDPYNLT
jgi:hypothetical protein